MLPFTSIITNLVKPPKCQFNLKPYRQVSMNNHQPQETNLPFSVFPSPILLLLLLPLWIAPIIPSMYGAPLHFWCVRTSTPSSFSRDWIWRT